MDKVGLIMGIIGVFIVAVATFTHMAIRKDKKKKEEFVDYFAQKNAEQAVKQPEPEPEVFVPRGDLYNDILPEDSIVIEDLKGMEIVSENEIVRAVSDVIAITGVIHNPYGYITEYPLIHLTQISGSEKIVISEESFFINSEARDSTKHGIGLGGLYSAPSVLTEKTTYFVLKLERSALLHLILRNHPEAYRASAELMNDPVAFSQKASACYSSFHTFARAFSTSGNRFDKFRYSLVNLGYSEKHFSHIAVFKFEYGIEETPKEQFCTWPIANLDNKVLDEINKFTNNATEFNTGKPGNPFLRIYLASNFTHIEITRIEENGAENIFLFSDATSYLNSKTFIMDFKDSCLGGKLLQLFPEISLRDRTNRSVSTGRNVIKLDDNRNIVWLYNRQIRDTN